MSPDAFTIAWQTFSRQRPFKPYTIEFASGKYIEVEHPEAISMHESVLVYRTPQGTYHLFDCEGVTRFISGKMSQDATDSTTSSA